jgi:hypothetical protein
MSASRRHLAAAPQTASPRGCLGIPNVYVGDGEAPERSITLKLDLIALSRLLDRSEKCP